VVVRETTAAPSGMTSTSGLIIVGAAVIRRDGRVLLTERLRGTHLEGAWEFPGGKCEPGERVREALRRELSEELGLEAHIGAELFRTEHAYDDRRVELRFFDVEIGAAEPRALLGQRFRWVPQSELRPEEMPPADAELVAWLRREANRAKESTGPCGSRGARGSG